MIKSFCVVDNYLASASEPLFAVIRTAGVILNSIYECNGLDGTLIEDIFQQYITSRTKLEF